MSSAINHRKRSHRSEGRHIYRNDRTPYITPDVLKPNMSIFSLMRNRMNIKRVAMNNAAKARPDTPAAGE